MRMTGEERIAADRATVWAALNDPAILRQCIPGCQSLEKDADGSLSAVAEVKIGPIGARFAGKVVLSELDPPNGYVITGEGQGGTVGSAKGGAKVRLAEAGGATVLSYEVDAQVGGRLAQLGGPLIDATAKQLAGKFFARFGEVVTGKAAPASSPAAVTAGRAAAPRPPSGLPIGWILAVALAALVGFLVGRDHGETSDWMGLSIGLLVIVVAAAAFEYGRRAAAPVVVLDPALLARLTEGSRR